LGQTELAIWQKQFQALRDGDRFYFGNDQGLSFIKSTYGIDFHHTLAQVIEMNTDVTAAQLNATGDVFYAADDDFPATQCEIDYSIVSQSSSSFKANLTIKNTTNTAVNGWTLKFELSQGQKVQNTLGLETTQSGSNGFNWTGKNGFANGHINANGSVTATFTASFDGLVNERPSNFTLNGHRCAAP
jgi:hypothetical protein